MIYLSDLLKEPVWDSQGRRVGVLCDLVIAGHESFPAITAVAIQPLSPRPSLHTPSPVLVPAHQFSSLEDRRLTLLVPWEQVTPYTIQDGEILLARDVLDKQIVDTRGRRIVRVNDLKLTQLHGTPRLLGADISFQALLRRLIPFKVPEKLVTWNYVTPLASEADNVRLKVPFDRLAELHPADLADLIEQMSVEEGSAILEKLDVETASDALEEMEPAFQTAMVQELDSEKAADLLEIMPPDEAADIIGDLSDEKAEEIVAAMSPEGAADVKELLQYEEDTAGGRMNPKTIALPESYTAQQTIDWLRNYPIYEHIAYYLYVVDDQERLVGVVSMRSLVTASPDTPLSAIMERDVIKVYVNDDQAKVAETIRKYNLLAVPVVDDFGRLVGSVTHDDAVDVIHEEAMEDLSLLAGTDAGEIAKTVTPLPHYWRQIVSDRLLRLALPALAGLGAGLILYVFAPIWQRRVEVIYFLPLLLLIAAWVTTQSLAVVEHGLIRSGESPAFLLWQELQVNGIVSVLAGLAAGLSAWGWLGIPAFSLVVGIGLAAAWFLSALLGVFVPAVIQRIGGNPAWASGPVMISLTTLLNLLLYLGLAAGFLAM